MWEDVEKELESEEYKKEYQRSINIFNDFLHFYGFIMLYIKEKDKLFWRYMLDNMVQSLLAIKSLLFEGMNNPCRREMRFLIELSIKSCVISQKHASDSIDEQLEKYKDLLKSTNISMMNDIDFYFFDEEIKSEFITEVKRTYGKLCNYVHLTPTQIKERFMLDATGRILGHEGTQDLFELNNELEQVMVCLIIMLFHSVPTYCVGDYVVEKNGDMVEMYLKKSKYIKKVDEFFDYKCERQARLDEIIKARRE